MPVYKDKERGTYFVKLYYTDYTGTRKQKKKRGFSLKREAVEWERAFLERLQGSPDMTFRTLYDIYMEDMSHRLRPSTIRSKGHVFEHHILPYFGGKPVNAITPADIRAWQNKIMVKELSDGYLDNIQKVLNAFLNYAVRYYDLPSSPCSKAGHMGRPSHSIKFWTLDQYDHFIQHVGDIRARTALDLLFYSGMRCGELLALTLGDLDFQANTISVTKTYHRGGVSGPPKTDNGVRRITMPAAIMQEIRAYTDRIYGLQPTDRVFTFTDNLIRGHIDRGAEKAGIPRIRIHDLRHSHVSLLIELGFSPHLIAERIGDTVQMVNNIYGHLYPSKHGEVADRLDQLIVPR